MSSITITECIKKAYNQSKDTKPSEQFRQEFNNQLAICIQEGLKVELRQRQIQELCDRIWYTTALLKPTFTKGVGQWLAMVEQVASKFLLERVESYKPAKVPTQKSAFDVPDIRQAILGEQ